MLGSTSIAGLNMLKEMGNQNTSGIVEQSVGCPDYLEQENETANQRNFDAKATESDSCDADQVQENHPFEKKAVNGYTSEDCETKRNGLQSKDEEVIEDHTQSSADLSYASPEDVLNTSIPQEIRSLSHCEEECDTKLLVQNCVISLDSSMDDGRVVTNIEDGSVETETPSVEGEAIAMTTHQGNCDLSCNMESAENGIRHENGVEDHPKVEMASSLDVPRDLPTVSEDTSASECEVKDEYLPLGATLTANKSSTFHVDQTQAEEEVQGTHEDDQTVKEVGLVVEMKDSGSVGANGEEEKLTDATTIEVVGTTGYKSSAFCEDCEDGTSTEGCSSEVVGSSLEIKKVNEPEREPETGRLFPLQCSNNEATTQQVLQSNGAEEKISAKSESSLEIKKLNELEPELAVVFLVQYANDETSRLLVSEPNGGEITEERCGLKSGSQLEIKKMDQPVLLPEPEHELEHRIAFPKQCSIHKTSSIQVLELNRGENDAERCELTSQSSSEIKKVDEPETGHSHAEPNSTNATSSNQVPELKGGENTWGKCRSTCESSLEIKKVTEPEPASERRHVFSEKYREKSTPQVFGQNGPERTLEKSRSQSKSCFGIRKMNESEPVSKPKAEPDSKQMLAEQSSNNETSKPESKEGETIGKLSTESNPNHPINQLELRKSPSFDFGLPFDSRSEESDQTPLLYQDRTAPRRFSSCSSYISPLHQEAVEVEEKTIRMERSTSDISRSPFLNLLKEEKPENLAVDKDQENGSKSSIPTEDCDGISAKRNGKRKPRSSLFTTCICCTTPSAFS